MMWIFGGPTVESTLESVGRKSFGEGERGTEREREGQRERERGRERENKQSGGSDST